MKSKRSAAAPAPGGITIPDAVIDHMIEQIAKKVSLSLASQSNVKRKRVSPGQPSSQPGIIRDGESYTVRAFMETLGVGESAVDSMVRRGLQIRTGEGRHGMILGSEYIAWLRNQPPRKRCRKVGVEAKVSAETSTSLPPPQQN